MPRQEELEIALRDSITPGLKAIARELRELAKAAKESSQGTGNEMDAVQKKVQALGESSRAAMRHVQEGFTKVVEIGKSILGIGGTVESVKQLTESLNELAKTRVQLSMFSQDTRISAESIDKMRGAMTRMGVEAKTADQYIGTMSNKLQELNALREGSQLFQTLMKMPGGVQFGNQLLAAGSVEEQIKLITQKIKTQTPEVQFVLAQLLGVPQSVLLNWEEYGKKVGNVLRVPPEIAQQYYDNLVDLQEKIEDEWNRFGAHALEAINKYYAQLNEVASEQQGHPLSAFLIDGFDKFDQMIKQDIEDVKAFFALLQEIAEWWRPDLKQAREDAKKPEEQKRVDDAFKQLAAPRTSPEGWAAAADEIRMQEEKNKLLDSIRQTLAGQNEMAGGYGIGLRHPGGAMQAGVGGFRPGRRGGGGGGGAAGAAIGGGAGGGPVAPATGALADRIGEAKRGFEAQLRAEGVPEANIKEAANLLAGQALAESSMNPRTSHDQGTGYGIYGARLERRSAMLSWMKANGYAPDSLEGQAKYMAHEAMSKDYPRTREALTGADPASRAERTDTITREFERPAVANRRDRQVERAASVDRDIIDGDQRGSDMWKQGTAAVTIDFGNTKDRNKESKPDGGVFKPLNNEREPQAPKSGSPATFSDRWYFQ